jgi:uncharacterized protein YkwD
MKRILVIVSTSVVVLTLALLVWQRANISRLISQPGRTLMGRAGGNAVAPKADFLSPTEKEMLSELNLARTNPQQYAAFLEEAKKTLSGNQIRLGGTRAITLKEGVSVVDEAIKFLREVKSAPSLEVSKGMCLGAKDHVKDMALTGHYGHKGTDGSMPEQRVSRYGNWQLAIGENIAYASSNAREAVLGMILDDGVAGRGHRLNIFNTAHHVAGVAAERPSPGITMCVVTYAGAFAEKSETAGAATAKNF